MFADRYWALTPPPLSPAMQSCLTDDGSLTERLIATGRDFTVRVLYQGPSVAAPDENGLIGVETGAPVLARHVALLLDGVAVVVARSIARHGCPQWEPVLARGSRSLGLTLFGEDSAIIREPLHYCALSTGHPLFPLARGQDLEDAPRYAARRSNFLSHGAALNVCEVFLPVLESFL
ncbi:MAG: chorismate lyase [Paludibacterium sp.]|uniref:chorismate--pyruvate lyase family protein n=1 Tax=Paludibacterium sp. TaxID=1917523 RepID=UPI0025F3D711|nr:chorismate lyase [Paludibacterium sp.]MBV8047350.1 chorismate lyase [Paludibacterium sp.]MBV8646640.1 chorismate lyase [Paludibacterium sp.]